MLLFTRTRRAPRDQTIPRSGRSLAAEVEDHDGEDGGGAEDDDGQEGTDEPGSALLFGRCGLGDAEEVDEAAGDEVDEAHGGKSPVEQHCR